MKYKNGFFSTIDENDLNKDIISNIKSYINENDEIQIYIINSPLSEKKYYEEYGDYKDKVMVILSPKHKIIFLNLGNNDVEFENFINDFIEDLGYISDKYDYKQYIGRPKDWNNDNFIGKSNIKVSSGFLPWGNKKNSFSIEDVLNENKLLNENYRKGELLISLLLGSINDVGSKGGANNPNNILEKIKNNILIFDGDQTRFIYEKNNQRQIVIQGLAGTGKTELLLHKLKELYLQDDSSKIFFTCKNVTLSRELNKRVPDFFNFMKVEKQIERNKRLWIGNAWGTYSDKNSGLYRYICNFYNIPFYNYAQKSSFDEIIKLTIEKIKEKKNDGDFEFAFDYVLIDESQDFTKSFFDLCDLITNKQVYIAGDLFQDIFDDHESSNEIEPTYILNKCYRTDPRTLMFAQSIGLGLFEKPHLNWLDDKTWENIGYKIKKNDLEVFLSRSPIRRFSDLDTENYESMKIKKITDELDILTETINIIRLVREENVTVTSDDIGIIYLDDYGLMCDFSNKLEEKIYDEFGWKLNRAFQNREKIKGELFISNQNHVKGLEFPFIICITKKIRKNDLKYRNSLYTMLTRSFIQSYLLTQDTEVIDYYIDGLNIINKENYIKTSEPSKEEKLSIKTSIINYKSKTKFSYNDFISNILDDLKIKDKLQEAINFINGSKYKDSFDEDIIKEFLLNNKDNF